MRQRTPGEFRAVGPAESTNPAPPTTLQGELAELRGALAVVGELCGKLLRALTETRIAQLASEHRGNVHRAKLIADRRLLGDHERRLREVERFQAGLEAERSAAGGE